MMSNDFNESFDTNGDYRLFSKKRCALRKEGFTEDEVEAIFFRNAQRFFENNL